jgi:hypothetical protein
MQAMSASFFGFLAATRRIELPDHRVGLRRHKGCHAQHRVHARASALDGTPAES